MIVYIAKQDSDMTEGRGPMVPIGYFVSEEAAVQAVKGRGVMGVGDGEVYKATIFSSIEDVERNQKLFKEEKVYGHRQDWNGRWGYGWVDNRDVPTRDPEFQEYLRLKEKFKG